MLLWLMISLVVGLINNLGVVSIHDGGYDGDLMSCDRMKTKSIDKKSRCLEEDTAAREMPMKGDESFRDRGETGKSCNDVVVLKKGRRGGEVL
jgi:hypothetical protein